MTLLDAIISALDALRLHKLRSALTMLGIIIGVAAVIAMVAVGGGAREQVVAQIRSLGANLLIVMPGNVTQGGVRLGSGAASTLTALSSASGPSTMQFLICFRLLILASIAASTVAGISGLTVSTAARIATGLLAHGVLGNSLFFPPADSRSRRNGEFSDRTIQRGGRIGLESAVERKILEAD